jgi:hypothetical protein
VVARESGTAGITSVKPFLALFVIVICFAYLFGPSLATSRSDGQDNSTIRPGSSGADTPTAFQPTGIYDDWKGTYKGTCDYAFEGKLHKNVTFGLQVDEPMGDGQLGFIGGFETDLKNRVTGVHFEIHLPRDLQKTDNFQVSSDRLSVEHTRRCPYKVEISRSRDQSGKTILSGSLVGYEFGPDGAFSSLIVMDVRNFRVMR